MLFLSSKVKKILLVAFIFNLFTACKAGEKSFGNVIHKDTFLVVLKEIHFYNAYYNSPHRNRFYQDTLYIKAVKSVLKKHNIKLSEFKNTIEFYLSNPKEFSGVYDTLISGTLEDIAKLEARRAK